MIDFDVLYKEIKKTEDCEWLEDADLKSLDYAFYPDSITWKINTQVTYSGKCLDILLYLNFPKDFPFSFPKIFINRECYEPISYIPHINEDLSVCVFDDGLNPMMPKSNIKEVLEFMISKVKNIIVQSGNIKYKKVEFLREFKAYWELKYSHQDEISKSGLHSIDLMHSDTIMGLRFTNKLLYNTEYFLSSVENEIVKIKEVAKRCDVKYEELSIVEIGNKFIEPPYERTVSETISIIKEAGEFSKFKEFFRTIDYNNILIIFKNKSNSVTEYYGWYYRNIITPSRKHGGFRNSISKVDHLLALYNKDKRVFRITFNNISLNRLQKRTSGYIENQKSVVISGLGSVGSNLIYFLRNLPVNKFHLIDKELLAVENIKRHYSGLTRINDFKAEVLKDELENFHPFYELSTRNQSVNNVIIDEPDFLNDCDIHIVAIGNTNVEQFILHNLQNKRLLKPTLIYWVEPYLASGQILFVLPEDSQRAIDLINMNQFPYSVLANYKEQINETYIIEGSCQSGYFPYSSTYLTQFLASTFQFLKFHLLDAEYSTSKIYSWIGDKNLILEKGLILSDFGKNHSSFEQVINNL